MATQTPNYGLSKPAGTDPVDISVLNGNADIIDTALHGLDTGKQPKETGKGLSTNDYTNADKAAVDDWKNGYIYQTASGTSTKTITLDPSSAYFVFITFGSWANFYFLNSTTTRAYIKQIVDQMSGDITTSYDGLSATFTSTAGNAFTLFARKLN